MKAILVNLKLRNFKGLKNVTLDFDEKMTTIEADNGKGKTTVFDAFNWVLFGKNSENKSDFSIKTLDAENQAMHKVEHEVTAVLLINGERKEFRRIYKEKYSKKRNSAIEEFTGHVEEFYINDVPKTATEYNSFVNEVFKTNLFRMVTDPTYFNEQMKWEQRREILVQIAGNITPEMILANNPELNQIQHLSSIDAINDKKKELDAKRKKCKDEYENIPARLDELDQQFKIDLTSEKELNQQRVELTAQLEAKQNALNSDIEKDNEENKRVQELTRERNNLQLKIQEEIQLEQMRVNQNRSNLVIEKNKKHEKIAFINSQIEDKKFLIDVRNGAIEKFRDTNIQLKQRFEAKQKEVFNPALNVCPSCTQKLPANKIEFNQNQFNTSKSEDLKRISNAATANNESVKNLIVEIQSLEADIYNLNKELITIENELKAVYIPEAIQVTATDLTKEIQGQIDSINEALQNRPKVENSELKLEIQQINEQIRIIDNEISQHGFNKQLKERQDQLISRQRVLMQELGDIELVENQLILFNKIYMESVEKSVNSMFFNDVKFKMFEAQINGSEKPTCVCLVNGVPYPDVNTAGQINAGLTIITALQDYYNILAPVFIDNRERVSRIIPMNNQIINLKKVEGVNQLTIA